MVLQLTRPCVLTLAAGIISLCLSASGGEPTLPASDLEVAELDLDERIQAARNALAEAKKQYRDDIAKAEMALRAVYDNTIELLNEQDPKLAAELSQERDAVLKNVKVPEQKVAKKQPLAKDVQEDDEFGEWTDLTPAIGLPRVVLYSKALTARNQKEISNLIRDHLAGSLMDRLDGRLVQKDDKGVFLAPPQIRATFYAPILLRPKEKGVLRINFSGGPYNQTTVTATFGEKNISDGDFVTVKKGSEYVLLLAITVNNTSRGDRNCNFRCDITDEKDGGVEVHVP